MLDQSEQSVKGSEQSTYLDWNNSIGIIDKAFEKELFVLIIGPKGTGKTSLVREYATQKSIELKSINFSLRTRESHLIGTKNLIEGNIGFDEGILVKSMREGNILYLDEINAAEADVLLRLDEALDDRRQIVLKESDGQVIKAKDSWFVIATINPLTQVGTKELPPQLLSRFPVRIRLDYPPEDVEYQIIKKHVKNPTESEVLLGIKLANTLRQASAVEELYYSPSIRETIAFAKLLEGGVSAKQSATIVFGNVYSQWGNVEFQKVNDIITSMFGS
ncbi:MoxR family ATPase [Marine Group I thaumarchaeote]|uniref:MoxR family ATPase n=3 Tax=Nitrososphaerota TaxID=651137 RepID=A0A7K4MN49_9ARCH|nr:putative ATPase family associated with various cellular activities (AAA) [uncultured marine crenarchaeote HF4000_APKG3E18]NWJ43002.1 MoxR family ATPase [Marine Group I thaumarchaeote]